MDRVFYRSEQPAISGGIRLLTVAFKDVRIGTEFFATLADGTVEKWHKLSRRSARLYQGDAISSFSDDWTVQCEVNHDSGTVG